MGNEELKRKISLFCNISEKNVIENLDADSIYDIPLMFEEQHVGDIIGETLGLKYTKNDLDEWHDLVKKKKLSKEVEEDLIAENQRLRMENAYLKKLQALVQERIKPKQSKK